MKWVVTLTTLLVIGQGGVSAQRAVTPADATVFIRLVGSVRAEVEEAGAAKQTADLTRVEIGTGSGFVISPHGYVLTNEHVVSNSVFVVTDGPRKAKLTLTVARIEVCFPSGASSLRGPSRCFEASVHSSDAALDLAVLFISASDLPYVAFGDSDVVRTGQSVNALGYPFGRQLEVGRVAAPDLVPEVSTSAGTVSALRAGDSGEPRALQINSTVNPGNSGGPLLDQDGYAVGVIRARVTGDSGIGFAIPINQAKDFLESRGLDSLMPARRLRLGASQSLEGKGITLRLPEGVSDVSPLRMRVETDTVASEVALRIDRSVSPWTVRQIEQTLTGSEAFERLSLAANESQTASRPGSAPILFGRASGTVAGGDGQVKMQYRHPGTGVGEAGGALRRPGRAGCVQRERFARLAPESRGPAAHRRGFRAAPVDRVVRCARREQPVRPPASHGVGRRTGRAFALWPSAGGHRCRVGVSRQRRHTRAACGGVGHRGRGSSEGRGSLFVTAWDRRRRFIRTACRVARCVVCDRRRLRATRGAGRRPARGDFAGSEKHVRTRPAGGVGQAGWQP